MLKKSFLLYSYIFLLTIISLNVKANENDIKFTNNWFTYHIELWNSYKNQFDNLPDKRCLEIGSYEGQATLYIANNFCNGKNSYIDTIDTWKGSVENNTNEKENLYERFLYNLQNHIKDSRVNVNRGQSSDILMKFVQEVRDGKREKYDFVYIDASHIAKDVLMDTVLAWEILKDSGLMFFDDYQWDQYPNPWLLPKPAINRFLESYSSLYKMLHLGYQVHIQKLMNDPNASLPLKLDVAEKQKTLTWKRKIKKFFKDLKQQIFKHK